MKPLRAVSGMFYSLRRALSSRRLGDRLPDIYVALVLTVAVFFNLATVHFTSADVRISNLDNINFASWSGSGDRSADDGICVYNDGGSDYLISAEGIGAGGSFILQDGARSISIGVSFRGSTGSFTVLSPNVSESFSGAHTSSSTCSGGTNATLRVSVTENNLRAAPHGSYSGMIYLTVAPL